MKCKDYEKYLDSFVDKECSPEKASAMRGHLQLCKACSAKTDDLKFWKESALDLPEMEPSEGLFQSIKSELREHEVEDSKRPGWWYAWLQLKPWAPVLGVSLVFALVGGRYWLKTAPVKTAPGGDATVEVSASVPKKQKTSLGLAKSVSWQKTWLNDLKETEKDYLNAIKSLESDLDQRKITWRQKDNEDAWQKRLLVAKKEWMEKKADLPQNDQENVIDLYQERIVLLQENLFASW